MKNTLQLSTSLICFVLCGASGHGALRYWDANDTAPGAGGFGAPSGMWGNDAWWGTSAAGTAPTSGWTADNTAVFAAGTDAIFDYAVDLNGDQSAAGIIFEEGKVTIGPNGTVVLTGAGGPVDVASGASGFMGSLLGGTVGLTKSGSGTLFFVNTSPHSYTGTDGVNATTTINGGALSVGDGVNTTLGSIQSTIGTGITNNATLLFNRPDNVTSFSGVISGTGKLIKQGNGNFKLASGSTNTYTGDTIINFGRLQTGGRSGRCIPTGSGKGNVFVNTNAFLDLAGNDVQINGLSGFGTVADFGNSAQTIKTNILTVGDNDQSCTFDGLIESVGIRGIGLIKIGAGTLTLTGANTYKMGTSLQAGTLLANNISGSGTGSGAVTNLGGVLGGAGAIGGPVWIEAGGTLSPGASIGTLTLNSDLIMSGKLFIELDKSLSPSNDVVTVAGALTNAGTGTVTVTNLGAALVAGDSFQLFNKALLNGAALTVVSGGDVVWTNKLAVDGSIAVLSVGGGPSQPPPTPVKITSVTGAGTGSVTVHYTNAIPGTNYVLQYNTNLGTANWDNLVTNAAGGATASQTDNSATGDQRYYRVFYRYVP